MVEETLHRRGTTLVRRLILAPGEATRWHIDPFHRVSVIFKGQVLAIAFRDGRASLRVRVAPEQMDWDEPSDHIHRAVIIADVPYEEVTIFFLAHPDDIAQPDAPSTAYRPTRAVEELDQVAATKTERRPTSERDQLPGTGSPGCLQTAT